MSVQEIHKICRKEVYSKEFNIKRSEVPDEKVPWSVQWPKYKPMIYVKTDATLVPPECGSGELKSGVHDIIFNAREEKGVDRLSFLGPYEINDEGVPLNPCGRTGIRDRGLLGRWGPNQEAAPILTRWARKGNVPGDPPKGADMKEEESKDEIKEDDEKSLPTTLEGVWSAKQGGTQTVLISDKLRNDPDPPHFAAVNNEQAEFWAHLWLNEKTKVKLRDIGNDEFTGDLALDKETKKVQITWSDNDVWTLLEPVVDIEAENADKKDGDVLTLKGKPILEAVLHQRKDESGWGIKTTPLKSGEKRTIAARRIFGEDIIDTSDMSEDVKKKTKEVIDKFFTDDMVGLYEGYIDDPRNTDNSWIEMVAYNFHDDSGSTVDKLKLKLDYDPFKPHWRRLYGKNRLHVSQKILLKEVAKLHGAYF